MFPPFFFLSAAGFVLLRVHRENRTNQHSSTLLSNHRTSSISLLGTMEQGDISTASGLEQHNSEARDLVSVSTRGRGIYRPQNLSTPNYISDRAGRVMEYPSKSRDCFAGLGTTSQSPIRLETLRAKLAVTGLTGDNKMYVGRSTAGRAQASISDPENTSCPISTTKTLVIRPQARGAPAMCGNEDHV
jgi:hypothetical protein